MTIEKIRAVRVGHRWAYLDRNLSAIYKV